MKNNRKAFTRKRLLVAMLILAMPSIVITLLSNKLQSNGAEKNTDILILVISGMENGVVEEDHIEVLPDFPMTRKEKIDTAKGFAIVKGYVTKEEADKLVFNELDNTTVGVTIVKGYKSTKASM